MAHGAVLRKNGFDVDQLRAITSDFRNAGLEPAEVAMMEYAQKVALRANEVSEEDIMQLRAHHLSDPEILDVTGGDFSSLLYEQDARRVGGRARRGVRRSGPSSGGLAAGATGTGVA